MSSPYIEDFSITTPKMHRRVVDPVRLDHLAKVFALLLLATATALVSVVAAQDGPQLSPIQLSAEKRQLIGLQFATVEDKELKDRIETTALVEPDEQHEGYVQTRFAGWIRNVFVNQTYQYVTNGQPLFTIYSPDLVSAEQEYLLALDTTSGLEHMMCKGWRAVRSIWLMRHWSA